MGTEAVVGKADGFLRGISSIPNTGGGGYTMLMALTVSGQIHSLGCLLLS